VCCLLMHSTSYLQLPICCTATVSVEALIGSAFRCSAPAVWNSLPQTVLSSDSVAVFKSMVKTFLISQAFSSSLLTNSLPGPSASEVTTLRRYTNLFIIIIIIDIQNYGCNGNLICDHGVVERNRISSLQSHGKAFEQHNYYYVYG